MKHLIFSILLFLMVFVGFSQSEMFNKTYNGNYPGLRNIEIVDDGYVGLGFDLLNGKYRILIIKVDEFGDTVWQKMYGDTVYDYYHGERNSLKRNTDGRFSLAGNKVGMGNITCMLTKFDQNFDTLWTRYYFDDSDFTVFYNHIQTSDGGYACVGYTSAFDPDGDILLVKTDSLGIMEWHQILGTGARDLGVCIVSTSDGGYLIGGGSGAYGDGDNYIIKTDSLGNMEWSKNYGHPTILDGGINNILKTNDGGYVFVASETEYEIGGMYYYKKGCVKKLDANFNELWYKKYGPVHFETAMGSIIELNDGRFAAIKIEGDPARSNLLFLNAQGDSLWQQGYEASGSTDQQWLYAIKQTQDNGFIMAGVAYGPQQMWLVKVDSCGCDTVGCVCDYSGVSEFTGGSENELLIYPNPAHEKLTIKSSGNIRQIVIIDYFGRIAKTITDVKESEKTIDISDLNRGLYFVKVETDEFVEIKKIIVN